jgi:hypothetical protein
MSIDDDSRHKSLFALNPLVSIERAQRLPGSSVFICDFDDGDLAAVSHERASYQPINGYFLSEEAAAAGAGAAAAGVDDGALSEEALAAGAESEDEELLSPEDFGLALP